MNLTTKFFGSKYWCQKSQVGNIFRSKKYSIDDFVIQSWLKVLKFLINETLCLFDGVKYLNLNFLGLSLKNH